MPEPVHRLGLGRPVYNFVASSERHCHRHEEEIRSIQEKVGEK